MDPFSQAGLGAVVGQLAGHRQLGFKAALIGAGAGALPDIDVLFSIGGDFFDQLITHRGITHSLFFAPVVGPALGWLIWYRERRKDPTIDPGRRNLWMVVVTLALLSHPLLDLLTPYGTQLLLPFSNARFAINAMPIIDPIYTGLLLGGLLIAWLTTRFRGTGTTMVAAFTLLASTAYLGYGWQQNERALAAANAQLEANGIGVERIEAFPTFLQVHFRRVVARSADVDRVGFYSTWTPCEISWFEAPRTAGTFYQPFLATRAGGVFDWFTMGWTHFTLNETNGGYRLDASDLRYGFEDAPLSSVFSVSVPVDGTGAVTGPAIAGGQFSGSRANAITRLIERTYAPACRIFNQGVIPDVIDDNARRDRQANGRS
jgi:inner membrane protein